MDGHVTCVKSAHFCIYFLRRPSELGLISTSCVKVEDVEEGAEPPEFVEALGPQDSKAYDCMLQGETPRNEAT